MRTLIDLTNVVGKPIGMFIPKPWEVPTGLSKSDAAFYVTGTGAHTEAKSVWFPCRNVDISFGAYLYPTAVSYARIAFEDPDIGVIMQVITDWQSTSSVNIGGSPYHTDAFAPYTWANIRFRVKNGVTYYFRNGVYIRSWDNTFRDTCRISLRHYDAGYFTYIQNLKVIDYDTPGKVNPRSLLVTPSIQQSLGVR